MTKFHISPKIAEAINGSVVKSERLIVNEIEQGYEVIDIKVYEKSEFDHQENYKVINGKCSCKKCAQAGIPCSHNYTFMQDGGPAHSAAATKLFLKKRCSYIVKWPADSPYLNTNRALMGRH